MSMQRAARAAGETLPVARQSARFHGVLAIALALVGVAAVPAWGQEEALPETWGTSTDTYLWVSSAAFSLMHSLTPFAVDSLGYKWRSGAGGDSYMVAPVNLPGGASVTALRLYYYDADAVEEASGYFGYWGGTPTVPTSWGTSGANSGTSNASGYGAADVAFTHTVANTDRAYFAQVYLGDDSNSIRFKGVRLTYRLQVSAAPGVATFADVPTSHPFFRYVEALVASGITAGCGGGNYCPDSPLTRGQMAVFLSSALGLHWQ